MGGGGQAAGAVCVCIRGRGSLVEPRQKLVFDRPLSSYVPQLSLSLSLLSSGCQRHRHRHYPLPLPLSSASAPGSPVLILVLSCCSLLHSVGVVKKYHYMRHIWQVCFPCPPAPFPTTPLLSSA